MEAPNELRRDLERESRLARTARACDGDEARPVREHPDDILELTLAADERGRDDRKIGCIKRAERREVAPAELEEALRADQVLQAVLPEVSERSIRLEEAARRLGDDDLAAVRGGCDPRRAMDVHADVALLGHERLAGVDAHPHLDRPGFERPLRLGRGGGGVGHSREGHEERIALGVHLDPVVSPEGLANHAPVLLEENRVVGSVLLKETRRPFDVGEEKRHGAGWQRLLHPRSDHLARTGGS